jgi:diguanylate cyclase (GGDEF)-like protein
VVERDKNMGICSKYEAKLNKLLEDENNIFYFCDIVKNRTLEFMHSNKEIIDLVLDFCKENDLNESKAWMYYYLAWHNVNISKYIEALEVLNEAREIFEKHDNKLGLAYTYNGLTPTYCLIGMHELSNEMGLRGIAIAKELEDEEVLISLLIHASNTNISSESYETAKEILDYIEVNYDYNNFDNLNRTKFLKAKAEVELYSKNLLKANEYIENAIKFEEVNGNSIFCPDVYKISGMIKLAMNKFSEARQAFKHACDLASSWQNLHTYCGALFELGKLMYNLGQSSKAIEYLDEVIQKSTEFKLNSITKNASTILYEHYKANSQFEQALYNLQIFRRADKEINSYKNMKLLAKLNIDHGEKELRLYNLLYDKTEVLYSIGEKIISNLDMESLTLSIYSELNKLMKVDFSAIGIYEANKDDLTLHAVNFGKFHLHDAINLEKEPTFSTYCIKNKKILVIDNIVKEYKKYVDNIDLEGRGTELPMSGAYVPLIINDKVIGNMVVQSLNEKAYESSDISYLKIIGSYVAIALNNALEYNKMEQIAIYDSLTGFLTRGEIIKEGNKIKQEFSINRKEFCILMIDLDDFKFINDNYGHVVGDNVMKMLAKNISRHIRTSDYIGRYGGDEFLIICQNMNMDNAFSLAERIRKSTEETKFYIDEENYINATLSIGLYEFSKDDLSFIEAVNFADMMLYKAKNMSKNKIMCFT